MASMSISAVGVVGVDIFLLLFYEEFWISALQKNCSDNLNNIIVDDDVFLLSSLTTINLFPIVQERWRSKIRLACQVLIQCDSYFFWIQSAERQNLSSLWLTSIYNCQAPNKKISNGHWKHSERQVVFNMFLQFLCKLHMCK